jgi:thiamine transport system substrate-binding protein
MLKSKFILLLVVVTVIVFAVAMYRAFSRVSAHTEDRAKAANLIVYTHSSFIDAYGPGAELKAEFEKSCVCTVEYVDVGGAAALIERIKLDPSRRVDVVVGLDYLLLSRAAENIRFQEIDRPEIKWNEAIKTLTFARFVPYDWSPMGFIYRQGEVEPAHSWSELTQKMAAKSVSLQDPSLSTPGLEWLYWLFSTSSDLSAQLKSLNRVVHSYSPSWSAAYGLFKKDQTRATFSYLTSLAYHWQDEKDRRYQFMVFNEGQPLQVEYAAVPEACWNCNVAKKFVEFLTSPFAQKIIAAKNYMLPVAQDAETPTVFAELPKVKILDSKQTEEFVKQQASLIELWRVSR